MIHDRDHAASRVILRDATVVRAAGVAPARREPARAFGRKRGALPRAEMQGHVRSTAKTDLDTSESQKPASIAASEVSPASETTTIPGASVSHDGSPSNVVDVQL